MKKSSMLVAVLFLAACGTTNNSSVKDGNKYIPYAQREGEEAVVYFTRNLSADGLIAAYEKVCGEKRITAADAAKGLKPFVKE